MTSEPPSPVAGTHGSRLRQVVTERDITAFIGVYDAFSASLAARSYDALFVSGFGFAASHYGLPDIGFIAWSDMVAFVQRLRALLPTHLLLVDIDDGYADTEVACHVTRLMEAAGASGVILEDQARPRACGHFDGKRLMPCDDFVEKLEAVLAAREDLFVVARTDSEDFDDILTRVRRFAAAGADAILVDGVPDLSLLPQIKEAADGPIAFNQLAGGKSPHASLTELAAHGVSLVNYSTPCLFAAQAAVADALEILKQDDGSLARLAEEAVDLSACRMVLDENLQRRKALNHPPSTT